MLLKWRKTRCTGGSERSWIAIGTRATGRAAFLAVLVAAIPSCTERSAPSASGPKESLGNVMVQVARRFEIAGRAANANRFELAEFEAGEIGELFESDVPNAELPKEGPTAHIPAMAKAFLASNAVELKHAAAAKDRVAFAAAFAHAALVCNACHQAAAKGFIQVPSDPGKAVPVLDPLPALPTPTPAP
jgi:hypothetical protein